MDAVSTAAYLSIMRTPGITPMPPKMPEITMLAKYLKMFVFLV